MAMQYCAYDDAVTKRMGEAFDALCGRLHGTDYPQDVLEAIADRILEVTRWSPERNPDRLAEAVMKSLGIKA